MWIYFKARPSKLDRYFAALKGFSVLNRDSISTLSK